MTDKPTVALLGTGIMGAGMGRNLLAAGLPLRVWNRSRDKAVPLADAGAELADSPAEAVTGADVIVTMLRDGDAVAEVINAAESGLREGQVWAQTTTVGVRATEELAELAGRYGLVMVDAPVQGSRPNAESGQLVIMAAGPESSRTALAPVFDAVGRRTVWLAEDAASAAASRLKLVTNSWVLALNGGTAEAIALARALGVDPRVFLDATAGGNLDSPALRGKAAVILAEDWEPSFSVSNAAKDADLIAEAGRAHGARMYLTEAVAARLHRAEELGHADEDVAANYFASFETE